MLLRVSFVHPSAGRRVAVRCAAAAVLAVSLAGCSTVSGWFGGGKTDVVADAPADTLYNEALYNLNQKEYSQAILKFQEVDKQHPYTEQAAKAIMMVAYVHYSRGDYDSTIESAKRYLTLYPGSPDAAYAEYLLAMSYYNQIPDISHDQADTKRALGVLQDVVNKYPDSEYAAAARKRIQVARDQLAGHELMIGRYYLKRRDYVGAVNRFRDVITHYQDTREVEEALARLAEAYMALGVVKEAQTAAAILGHNFPSSQWYKDTYTLIKSKGLEPREDTGSWISKAFKKVGLG
jgi:outer membrane protein assembly factor BamD